MTKPTLVLSLDFELFWGMQDVRNADSYSANILGGREAIPRLLTLFKKHGIHATWATVGFMFADNATEALQFAPAPNLRPTYKNSIRSAYRLFENKDELDKKRDLFFAPEIIQEIADAPGMEIGCHTFSHFYCREAGQTVDQFTADLKAAKEIAQANGFALASIVLPRNQCAPEYTKVLAEFGFSSFRDEENDWIHRRIRPFQLMRAFNLLDVYLPLTGQGGYIPEIQNGIVCLSGSRMFKPYFKPLSLLESLKLLRIKKQMLYAAQHGLTFHLWWHPHNIGVHPDYHLRQLERIFMFYDKLNKQYGMQSLNMNEAAELIINSAE